MSDDSRKAEHDLLREVAPVINQMGIDAAADRAVLNGAVRDQLSFVKDQLDHYIPTSPRGWGNDSQMPHEWGSMDTYDDMRNSMRLAALMLDELCAPDLFTVTDHDDPAEALRTLIVLSEAGICACSEGVIKRAGLEGDDDFDILAKTARRIESERGLERNSLFPTSE